MKLKSVRYEIRNRIWDKVSDDVYDNVKPVWYKVWNGINGGNTDLHSNFVSLVRYIAINSRTALR